MQGAYALGADVAWQAGSLGIATAQLAMGGDNSASGWLAGLGFEHNGHA